MRNMLFVLLSLFIVSCFNKDEKQSLAVPLFNDQLFNMYDGELLEHLTPATQKMYEDYFNNTEIQIPLFKHIKHDKYDIFIGLPVNASVSGISEFVLEKHDGSLRNHRTDNNFCYNQYSEKGLYLTEYAIKLDNRSLFYIASITQSKIIADSLFNVSKLERRISKGKF